MRCAVLTACKLLPGVASIIQALGPLRDLRTLALTRSVRDPPVCIAIVLSRTISTYAYRDSTEPNQLSMRITRQTQVLSCIINYATIQTQVLSRTIYLRAQSDRHKY